MTTGESSRSATVKAPEETPSKLLRQLSRAIAQPELDQQLTSLRQKAGIPRRRVSTTPRTPRTRRTSIIQLTPSTRRLSLRKQNKKDDKLKPKKKDTQELLRVLSRAPGFVQKPQVIPHILKSSTHHIPNNDNDDYVPDNDQVAEKTNIEYSLLTAPGFVQKPQVIPKSSIHHIPNNDNDDYVPDNDQVAEETNIEYSLLTAPGFAQNPQAIPHIPKSSTHHIPYNDNDDYVPDSDQVAEETNIEYSLLTAPGFVQKPQVAEENNIEYSFLLTAPEFMQKPQVKPHIPESSIHHIPNNDNDDYVPDNDQVAEENTEEGSSKPKEPKPKGPPQLPKSLIKKVFNSFSNAKLSKAAMQVVFEGSQLFFEQIATDLATYATHSKREIIQDKDVLLLMKRQGLINDNISFEYLAERYLPRELMNEVCVVARAGN
ncbi:33498_t:CDS:2, partial [Gigaspora margarita]